MSKSQTLRTALAALSLTLFIMPLAMAADRPLYEDQINPLNSIRPEAINQGDVDDCYFLSALASLAQVNPEAIKDMIKDNGNGTYDVNFPGARNETITVKAPTGQEHGASGGNYGTWVPVLEKAYGIWCKKHWWRRDISNQNPGRSDAEGAAGGSIFDAGLTILTPGGVTNDGTLLSTQSEISDKLVKALKERRPVTAGTGHFTNRLGLVTNHSFSVIGFLPSNTGNPGDGWLIVRNPYGDGPGAGPHGSGRATFRLQLSTAFDVFHDFAFADNPVTTSVPPSRPPVSFAPGGIPRNDGRSVAPVWVPPKQTPTAGTPGGIPRNPNSGNSGGYGTNTGAGGNTPSTGGTHSGSVGINIGTSSTNTGSIGNNTGGTLIRIGGSIHGTSETGPSEGSQKQGTNQYQGLPPSTAPGFNDGGTGPTQPSNLSQPGGYGANTFTPMPVENKTPSSGATGDTYYKIKNSSGQIHEHIPGVGDIITNPDGSSDARYVDGTDVMTFRSGAKTTTKPDGTKIMVDQNGKVTVVHANGGNGGQRFTLPPPTPFTPRSPYGQRYEQLGGPEPYVPPRHLQEIPGN